MNILGVNAFNHEPSACLIAEGRVAAAVEEEKAVHRKHVLGFPERAIRECLDLAGLMPSQVDMVALPRRHGFEIRAHALHMLRNFPRSLNLLRGGTTAIDGGLKRERYLHLRGMLRHVLHPGVHIVEVGHHEAHAASVCFQSEWDDLAIAVADGIAEFDTTWLGAAEDGQLRSCATTPFPHSLGMAYAAVTEFLGFEPFNDEWKVMGMAAYGAPRYYEELRPLLTATPDGHVRIDGKAFDFPCYGRRRWFSGTFRLRGLERAPDSPILQEHYDFARSFQSVIEDTLLELLRFVREAYPEKRRLGLSGGVFLNCLFNGRLAEQGLFDEIYVDCNPGDAGTALGAACHAWRASMGRMPEPLAHDNSLGRAFGPDVLREAIERAGLRATELHDPADVASLIDGERIIGLFEGRSEFGPRALGARSILADPRLPQIKDIINGRVKYREHFRPFAPSILEAHQESCFVSKAFSPYMSFALHAKEGVAERMPAVIHADGTARIQTVRPGNNPFYHAVIEAFHQRTSVPAVLNTSFNVRGEPIAYTPQDAIETFKRANLSALVLWPYVIEAGK